MTLRRRKTDGPPRALSEAQAAAVTRNFRIFRLRGLHSLAHILSPDRRRAVQAIIDDELISLGVEGQTAREDAERARWERDYPALAPDPELEAELPF